VCSSIIISNDQRLANGDTLSSPYGWQYALYAAVGVAAVDEVETDSCQRSNLFPYNMVAM
jgi:hypothetical protein